MVIAQLGDDGSDALVCPGPRSTRVFGDARDDCATRATALAMVEDSGDVSYFVDLSAMPCREPGFDDFGDGRALRMRGLPNCDTDRAGGDRYLFPHCSLTMNYPGNEDFHPGRPIGLLVEPYDCGAIAGT